MFLGVPPSPRMFSWLLLSPEITFTNEIYCLKKMAILSPLGEALLHTNGESPASLAK